MEALLTGHFAEQPDGYDRNTLKTGAWSASWKYNCFMQHVFKCVFSVVGLSWAGDLLPVMCERAGFQQETSLILYEVRSVCHLTSCFLCASISHFPFILFSSLSHCQFVSPSPPSPLCPLSYQSVSSFHQLSSTISQTQPLIYSLTQLCTTISKPPAHTMQSALEKFMWWPFWLIFLTIVHYRK